MFMGLVAAAIMASEPDMDRDSMPALLRRWAGDTPHTRASS